MKNEKTKKLYFLAMGCDYTEEKAPDMKGSDVGNYRIRTTFHDKNGDIIFIECTRGYEREQKGKKFITTNQIKLNIDHLYNKTISNDENESHIDHRGDTYGNYTKKDLLDYINKKFGCDFDELVVVDHLTQFDYNTSTGDEFELDVEKYEQVKKIYNYFYKYQKEELKKQYPNGSLYWEGDILKMLIHYNCYNDIIEIKDVFKYKFDYKKPSDEFLNQKASNYWANFRGC